MSERTASKWVARYRREGEVGLADRSSAPKALANRTDESRIETIAALRRLRMTGAGGPPPGLAAVVSSASGCRESRPMADLLVPGPEVRDGGLQIEYGLGCKARQERSAAVLERWLADREL